MLLVVKLAKLRVVVFRNAFCLKFNIHAFTRFSIYTGVVLILTITRKFTSFCRLIYYTSLRHLGGWARR
jgi:hypothetical protein